MLFLQICIYDHSALKYRAMSILKYVSIVNVCSKNEFCNYTNFSHLHLDFLICLLILPTQCHSNFTIYCKPQKKGIQRANCVQLKAKPYLHQFPTIQLTQSGLQCSTNGECSDITQHMPVNLTDFLENCFWSTVFLGSRIIL